MGNFSISSRVYDDLLHYFREAFAVSGYQSVGGEIQGEYRLEPTHLSIFGNLRLSETLHETTDHNDYDTGTFLVGVKGVYSKLDYSIAAGYTAAEFIHRSGHESGPSVLASLRYTQSRRLDFYLQAQRRFKPSAAGGLTTETDVNFTTRLILMDRARLLLGVARNESDRSLDGRLISTEESATFEYYLARFASLRAGYSHNERNTTSGLPEFRSNEGRVGFHLAW